MASHLRDVGTLHDDGGRRRDSLAASDATTSSTLDADNVSILSSAASAIRLAKELKVSSTATAERASRISQPQRQSIMASSPVLDALTTTTEWEAINDFIKEIVGLSEELQLYSKNPSQPQSPQQLAKITSTAMKLCDNVRPQQQIVSSSPRLELTEEVESPIQSFRDSIFSSLTRESNNTSVSAWSPFLQDAAIPSLEKPEISRSTLGQEQGYADVATSPRREAQSNSASRSISEAGSFIIDLGLPAKEPLTFRGSVRLFEPTVVGVNAIPCTLDFAEAGDNIPYCTITAVAVNQRRRSPTPRSGMNAMALTPQAHLDMIGNESDPGQAIQEHRRVFHHKFSPIKRPFPHTLHPSVEGPGGDQHAPYTIEFPEPQYLEEEGLPHPPSKSMRLKYIFTAIKDRDILQSLIFGKALLVGSGIDKVVITDQKNNTETERSLQTVRLWQPADAGLKSLTVYFRSKSGQKIYKEYVVLGVESQVRKLKAKDPLKIPVMEVSLAMAEISRRRSSTTSAQTMSSRGSIASAASGSSKPTICCLQFSNDAGRTDFLRWLT